MLNSDKDLDRPNRQLARSRSLQSPQIATELSIEQSKSMPIFTEATAQAILLLDAPVSILTIVAGSGDRIAAISGLEQFLSLPPNPDLLLEFAGLEYCHAQLFNSGNSTISIDCQQSPQLAQSSLCHRHGIQAYVGVPIVTAAGDRLGTLAILDFKPRQVSDRDIELLQLVSRLVASEFERKLLSQAQLDRWVGDLQPRSMLGFDDSLAASEYNATVKKPSGDSVLAVADSHAITDVGGAALDKLSQDYPQVQSEIQFKLLTHLAQELRTPLTSVVGMASVLQQEIYGSLSRKQKDYLGIIYHSGQQLVAIVDEMSQLGEFNRHQHQLTLKLVDLEMLCQLALQSLEPLAQEKQQQLVLVASDSADPEALTAAVSPVAIRRWLLDKEKVRQIVYYLCLSLIQASDVERHISIQLSDLTDRLEIQIVSNDPQVLICCNRFSPTDRVEIETADLLDSMHQGKDTAKVTRANNVNEINIGQDLRISLGLSLSHNLAVLHGGKIEVIADGRGYQFTLPLIVDDRE
jgi:signal transduction histidine kinase